MSTLTTVAVPTGFVTTMAASCAMKVSPAVAQPQLAGRRVVSRASAKSVLPIRSVCRAQGDVSAQRNHSVFQAVGLKVEHAVAVSTAVSTFLLAGNAQAAQEIAAIAADNRIGTISTLFLPVLAWVGFNILGPAFNQLDSMTAGATASSPKKATKRVSKASVAAAVGAGLLATMLTATSVEAATEVAQLAGGDSRASTILTLFVPAVAWVAFNIFDPAKRQLDGMSSGSDVQAPKATRTLRRKAGLAAAVGVSAAAGSALLAESASAATEFAQVADTDVRVGVILTLFVPAVAWVAFNIFGPALRQLNDMTSTDAPVKKATTKVTKRRSVGAAVGLTAAASMLTVQSASAATEIAQVADTDVRVGVILTLFVPAVAWVAFNIFGPALRQLNDMTSTDAPVKKATTKVTKRRSVGAAVGLTAAASMLAAQSASAATEIALVADTDVRVGVILTLFVPAVAWVAFNIFGPALRQLNDMTSDDKPAPKKSTTKITKKKK